MANQDDPTTTDDILSSRTEAEVTLPEPRERDDEPTQPGGGAKPSGNPGSLKSAGGLRKLSQDFDNFRNNGYRQHIESAIGPLNQQIAELKQLLTAQRQSAAPSERREAKESLDEATGLINEMNSLVNEYSAATTDDRRVAITKRHGELSARLNTTREKALRESITADLRKELGGKRQQQENGDPIIARADAMIQDDFPELISGAEQDVLKALRMVNAYVNREVTVEERPRTLALYREAAAHIRAKLGKGEPPAPTRDRQTFQSGRGQGGGGSPKSGGGIKMPVALLRSALNAVPGMDAATFARHIEEQDD